MENKKEWVYWADKLAQDVIDREKKFKRGIKVFRTESGIGASGFPHIGSFGDVVRNYGVSLALKDAGVRSEFIAYSDNFDGLRKVPLTLPDSLEKFIGVPIAFIPDPFGCHASYGDHMSSLLIDAMDKAGIEYNFQTALENYKKGVLDEEIEAILVNAEKVGQIVKKLTGQEKFIATLPYFPVCENCGKLYTTKAYELVKSEHKVLYVCDQDFKGKNLNNGKGIIVNGCKHKGEAKYFKGNGKLSWKPEFAARWKALKIAFEAYGKDIRDSIIVNDAICKEILGFEPPLHVMYEMFLDKGGKKISKSYGNVFTPQVWFDYGTTQSCILLMLKRFEGTRELDVTDIPKYMDEMLRLSKVYFKLEKVGGTKDLANLKRLFEYVHFLKPPKKLGISVPYDVMVEIAKVLPEKNQVEFASEKLNGFGYLKKTGKATEAEVAKLLEFAKKWAGDFEKTGEAEVSLSKDEKNALSELIDMIKIEDDAEILQKRIFDITDEYNIKPARFFKIIYTILLNSGRGPRLGPYILQVGKSEIIKKLNAAL